MYLHRFCRRLFFIVSANERKVCQVLSSAAIFCKKIPLLLAAETTDRFFSCANRACSVGDHIALASDSRRRSAVASYNSAANGIWEISHP